MDNLLRPHQVKDEIDIRHQLENKLGNPHIQHKEMVSGQLNRLNKRLDQQTPQPVVAAEKDAMIKTNAALLETITDGMLSAEEMRKCPPGAIDAHRAWENKNKKNIIQWKNTQLRLNTGCDDIDIANIEKYRPKMSRMNLDNAVIPGQSIHIPSTVGPAKVISDEELDILREKAPKEVWNRLSTMDSEQRSLALRQYVYGD